MGEMKAMLEMSCSSVSLNKMILSETTCRAGSLAGSRLGSLFPPSLSCCEASGPLQSGDLGKASCLPFSLYVHVAVPLEDPAL